MTAHTAELEPSRDLPRLTDDLCAALLTPRNVQEMRRLLVDLCTPAEIRTMAERWHVARLLDQDQLSYREIQEETGVSTTTVVRVARFLRQEPSQGYRMALDALAGTESRNAD
jgi:TrpR-related protein YerC/YecD